MPSGPAKSSNDLLKNVEKNISVIGHGFTCDNILTSKLIGRLTIVPVVVLNKSSDIDLCVRPSSTLDSIRNAYLIESPDGVLVSVLNNNSNDISNIRSSVNKTFVRNRTTEPPK